MDILLKIGLGIVFLIVAYLIIGWIDTLLTTTKYARGIALFATVIILTICVTVIYFRMFS